MEAACNYHCDNNNWNSTCELNPPQRTLIEVKLSNGSTQKMRFYNGLFWLPDMSMYVYYTPEAWRYA